MHPTRLRSAALIAPGCERAEEFAVTRDPCAVGKQHRRPMQSAASLSFDSAQQRSP
jgi:hypothetical protein